MKKGFMTVKELYERAEELGLENLIVNLDALEAEEEKEVYNIGEIISEKMIGGFIMKDPPCSISASVYAKYKDCVIRTKLAGEGKLVVYWDRPPERDNAKKFAPVRLFGIICDADWTKIR